MNTTTADTTPPTPPTNLVATAASPGSVALTWDASSDNDMVWQYWIYQGETVISSVHSSSLLLYVVNKLDPAREYCFTVSASDGAGNMSGRSNRACATTPPDLTPPTVPTNLNVTADTPTGITLSWPASTDDGFVAGYRVYRDGVLITTTADTWLTDSGLSTETQYCYAVQAFDAGGNQSALSNLACATTSWKHATIESYVDVQWTAIALDGNDKVYIAYYNGTYTGTNVQVGTVNYATIVSGTWQSTVLDSVAPIVYGSLSLLSNTDGSLHAAYYDFQNSRLNHAMNTSGTWTIESIDSNAMNVTTVSMAHDASGNLHLVFNPDGNVTYMTNGPGYWTSEIVGRNGVIYGNAATCSIASDAAGKAHIGYYDYTNGVLKYVTNTSGSWVTETVDDSADVGLHTAIAVDAGSKSHLSYYDVSNGDLKYATNKTGYWVTQTVDSVGDVGPSAAIALDANGHAHISYTDATNHFLKYATNASGSWTTKIIDGPTYVEGMVSYPGAYTAIAVDSIGKIHISYGSAGHLRYATNR